MITEDYVSFEIAKLLKEKGFDLPVHYVYHYWANAPFFHRKMKNFNSEEYRHLKNEWYSAPTQFLAMKWLREVHKLHIILDIHWLYFANQNGWMYTISRILENGNEYVDSKGDENDKNFYPTYEEACEAAIKYCLENLI